MTAADICWTLAPSDEGQSSGSDDPFLEAILDATSYRLLAQQALHALHHVSEHRDRLLAQRRLDRDRMRAAA